MNYKGLSVSLILILGITSSVFAQKSPVQLLLGGALEVGGEEIAEILFEDGGSQTVRSGQGISGYVGGEFTIPSLQQLAFRASLGFKYVTTAADNAHIRLTRIPFQFTANYYIIDDLRIGAGLVTHQNIRFKADGVGPDLDFDPASGTIFEVAYRGFGLSVVIMDYTDEFGNTFSATAAGLTFSGTVSL
ncbi:MAG: hypothetical protein ED557_14730 [Balneola sp.]|nr:MAG: hypothetical protein ED557_14730 [Balneola sp.]